MSISSLFYHGCHWNFQDVLNTGKSFILFQWKHCNWCQNYYLNALLFAYLRPEKAVSVTRSVYYVIGYTNLELELLYNSAEVKIGHFLLPIERLVSGTNLFTELPVGKLNLCSQSHTRNGQFKLSFLHSFDCWIKVRYLLKCVKKLMELISLRDSITYSICVGCVAQSEMFCK